MILHDIKYTVSTNQGVKHNTEIFEKEMFVGKNKIKGAVTE